MLIREKFRDGTPDGDICDHMDRLHDIIVENDYKSVFEIGTNYGNSTIAFLEGLRKTGGIMRSLDVVDCPVARQRVELYFGDVIRDNPDFWNLIVKSSVDYVLDVTVDVLFIDSGHTYDLTIHELRRYSLCVKAGGSVILHDTTSSFGPDVTRAVNEFLDNRKGSFFQIEHHEHNHGLAVLRRFS